MVKCLNHPEHVHWSALYWQYGANIEAWCQGRAVHSVYIIEHNANNIDIEHEEWIVSLCQGCLDMMLVNGAIEWPDSACAIEVIGWRPIHE